MNWPKTPLSERLQIRYPILQTPMVDGITTPRLVAAVSNAGGLGCLAAGHLPPRQIQTAIEEIRNLTDKPFAVNLLVPQKASEEDSTRIERANELLAPIRTELGLATTAPVINDFLPDFKEQLAILIEQQVGILSFSFGVPNPEDMRLLKEQDIITLGTATHLLEAIVLEESGVDIIVAQGAEAGGHRGTFIGAPEQGLVGSLALLPLLAHHIRVPLVASGGIMDGRGIAAIFALGAAGVQMGTAFLTCPESGAHPKYKELLPEGTEITTLLTQTISGRLARVLKNSLITELEPYTAELPGYPVQYALTYAIRQSATAQERPEFMALWAGQGCAFCANKPVAQLFKEWDEQFFEITGETLG
jgi:nitronate monooxygenase